MANKSIFMDRSNKGGQLAVSQGQKVLTFNSSGIATVDGIAVQDLAALLSQFKSVNEVGKIGITETEGTAGNAAQTITVPTGKYWRLLALVHWLDTDSNVANRAVVVKTRNAADSAYETITHANVAADQLVFRTTVFTENDRAEGSRGVAASKVLTIETEPTADDTITIDGLVYKFVAALSERAAGDPFQVLLTGTVADTQTNLSAALAQHPTVSIGAWSSDDATVTARQKGTAGNSIAIAETMGGTNNLWAGGATALSGGLDFADKVSTLNFPASGPILTPGEDVNIAITNGVAGDAYNTYLIYVEYDNDPR
jgi:hypothetical protein